MDSAVSPNGMTPRPSAAAARASQTARASPLGAQISYPRSPVKPVREIVTGIPAIAAGTSSK